MPKSMMWYAKLQQHRSHCKLTGKIICEFHDCGLHWHKQIQHGFLARSLFQRDKEEPSFLGFSLHYVFALLKTVKNTAKV
jgi:hypothetical protein